MSHGGVGNYLHVLTSRVNKDVFNVLDLSLRKGSTIEPRVPFTLWNKIRRSSHAIKDGLLFERILNKVQIDLIHLNPSIAPTAILRDTVFARKAYKAGIPFVVFFHGWNKEYATKLEETGNIKRLLRAISKAERIFVLALEFKRKLIEWGIEDKRIIIETTMVEDTLLENFNISEKLEEAKSSHKIDILFLSRIIKEKGIYEATDAIHILRQRGLNVNYVIAGDGPEGCAIKNYVKLNDIKTKFTGFVSGKHKKDVFRDADIYIFPSYTEGMPISVIEAMAFGLPVITRPVGGLKDFFEDGKMGYITDSLDPKVYADILEKLILNPELRKQIGRYNHKYAMDHFLSSQVTQRMETNYLDILNARDHR